MKQTATFKVTNKANELVSEYQLDYSSAEELNELYQEARRVWAEYFVTAETQAFDLSDSHTYVDQLRMEELQWEYMNGEYPDEY